MMYANFYDEGPGGFSDEFRERYEISSDVLVERVTGDRITFGVDFITLPLFAIIEGGVRFPMSHFFRYFLSSYNLMPCQVSVNTWRILCSATRLAKRNNLPFTLGDLILMYLVSRNPSYNKYYMSTRQGFDHLVDRLYDLEKWASVFDKVSGNFEWDRWTLNWSSLSQPGAARKLRGPLYLSSVGILCFFCQEPHYICYSRPRAFLSVLLFKNCCSVLIFSFIFRRLLCVVQGPLHLRQVEKLARPSPVCKQGRAYSARLRANLPPLHSKKRRARW